MDSIIPWDSFVKETEPYYYKGERRNKPYPPEFWFSLWTKKTLGLVSGCFFVLILFLDICGVALSYFNSIREQNINFRQ